MLKNLVFAVCVAMCMVLVVKAVNAACPDEVPGIGICGPTPGSGTTPCNGRTQANCNGDFNQGQAGMFACAGEDESGTQCGDSEMSLADCITTCECYWGLQNGTAKCLKDDTSCGSTTASQKQSYPCL